MIQYFYTGSYDYTHARFRHEDIESSQERLRIPRGITLSHIMGLNKKHGSYVADETADGCLNTMQIDVAMYQISDKYGIAGLRSRALHCVKMREIKPEPLIQAFDGELRQLMCRDSALKKAVAQKVADCYKKLRKHHSSWIEQLILSDAAFGILVMDCMEKVEEPLKTIKNHDDRDVIIGYNQRPMQIFKPPTTALFPTFAQSANTETNDSHDNRVEAKDGQVVTSNEPAIWRIWHFTRIFQILPMMLRYFR